MMMVLVSFDDPEFMGGLPDDIYEEVKSIRDEKPWGPNINLNIWKDKMPPREIILVIGLLNDQTGKQLDCLQSALECFIKNCIENGEVDAESIVAAIKAAIQVGMLWEEASQIFHHSPDLIKAMSARENHNKTLGPVNDRRQAESYEFWEPWRRQYRQRIDLFGDTKSEAFKWVVGEMAEQGARLPSTGEFPSETILYKQLRK